MTSSQHKGSSSNPPHSVMLPDDADHSILQQPLNHGVKNVKQILSCIQSGSREIKDIILNECNVIYECKVCLSLFRSLANLVYHKRGFCKKHLCENMLLFETFKEPECEVVLPQPVVDKQESVTDKEPIATTTEKTEDKAADDKILLNGDENIISLSDDSDKANDSDECVKSTSEKKENIAHDNDVIVIEDNDSMEAEETKESAKTETGSCPENSGHDSDVEVLTMSSEDSKVDADKHESKTGSTTNDPNKKLDKNVIPIIFKPIAGNHNAVFQVVLKDTFSSQPVKVKSMVIPSDTKESGTNSVNQNVSLVVPKKPPLSPIKSCGGDKVMNGSPERPKDPHLTRRKRLLNRSDCNVQNLECLNCSSQYTTLKTLYFHMMSFHSQKRMYYSCPFCKSLFVQMYGVTRHLIQVHGKTKEQINNKMRDQIRKKVVWKQVSSSDTNEVLENAKKEPDHEGSSLKKEQEDAENKKKLIDVQSSKHNIMHSYVRMENNVSLHHCSKCQRVFSRKSSQVSHEKFCIMNSPSKSENFNQVTLLDSPSPTKSDIDLEKKNPVEIRLNVRPKRGAEKPMHKDFVDSQTLKWRSANRFQTTSPTSATTTTLLNKKKPSKALEKKILSLVNSQKLLCLKCERKFSSFSNLRRHAAIHIGWTRFKCKCCEYQSYNKSDIIHHIQRMHTPVPEDDLPKFVISLLTGRSKNKMTSPKAMKPLKCGGESKKCLSARRKKSLPKKNEDKRKSQTPPSPTRHKTTRLDAKIVYQKSLPIDNRKKKSVKSNIQSKYDSQHARRGLNSYRSLTTNSPTTIILSKTDTESTAQTSLTSLSANNVESGEKALPTRISPRKFDGGIKVIKSQTASGYETAAVIHRNKNSIVKIQVSTEQTLNKSSNVTPEKNSPKKSRPISDWFVKKSSPATATVPRREAGPVIIDLIPASHTQRSKNASVSSK